MIIFAFTGFYSNLLELYKNVVLYPPKLHYFGKSDMRLMSNNGSLISHVFDVKLFNQMIIYNILPAPEQAKNILEW